MKKNISGILLVIVVIVTGILIGIVIIENKNKTNEVTYNYKKGDVINIEDFDIPSLTLTNIITFVKTLAQAVKALGGIFKNILNSKMAKYRQDLRDITEQPGFPFNVEWPVLEKDNNDDEE